MLFNSLQFLLFLPIVTLLYFIIPRKFRYLWLLAASYFFYMCWNPRYALLMLASTAITFLSGILINYSNKKEADKASKEKKLWVALSFVSNLGILAFFKYSGFIFRSLQAVFSLIGVSLNQPTIDILLPVGISFYTFQALSYTIDIYRGNTKVEKNFFRYALFVSFFPQLVAGPIERSSNLLSQLHETPSFNFERAKNGVLLMLWGYFQKVVIADRAAILVDEVFNNYTNYAGFQIAIAAILFAVQIYCDFGGYSNIAIGVAEIYGINLMANFKQPYFAISVKDFWRRWHISLSTWFRDYLYIPLGGNRKGKIRTYVNTMIVFLVSGLWHGASWNYVVWGGLHGGAQIISDITKSPRESFLKKLNVRTECFSYRLIQRIITFIIVDFAWIFFRAPGTRDAIMIIQQMFSKFNPEVLFVSGELYKLGLDRPDFIFLLISIAVLFIVDLLREKTPGLRLKLEEQNIVFRWALYYIAIFTIIIFGIYGGNYDASQFIYFQF